MAPSSSAKRTFGIKGMHCASCVLSVEESLKAIDGVSDAAVNLATEEATVTYDPARVDDRHLSSAVASVGYQAILDAEALEEDQRERDKARELADLKFKVIFSLFIAAIIVWGSFPGLASTAPSILKNPWLQLLLALPIQLWVGSIFYRAAWSSLKHRSANMDTLVALGTSVAFLYSVVVTIWPSLVMRAGIAPEPYFDVVAVIIGLILLGRYFEARAKAGTSAAIKKLLGLAAKTARVIRNGTESD